MIFSMLCQFDFWENGQDFPSVADWQAVLERDADGVLSVCRKIGGWIPNAVPPRSAFDREKISAKEELERLLAMLQSFSQRLPRPTGFFSSSEDRKKAHEVSCRFLEGLERSAAEICVHDAVFLNLFSSLREQEEELLRCEALLVSIRKAAKRQGVDSVWVLCQEILERIGSYREERALFRTELKRIKEELQGFCRDTVPDFCRRIAILADLEGEGKGGSPQGILQLFGEMRHEIERLVSAF